MKVVRSLMERDDDEKKFRKRWNRRKVGNLLV